MSNLPTGQSLSLKALLIKDITVGLPLLSLIVVIYPLGKDEGVNITNLVNVFTYVESILSPSIAATLVVVDSAGLLQKLPIQGTEVVEISVITNQSEEPFDYRFRVWQVGSRFAKNQQQAYNIGLIAEDKDVISEEIGADTAVLQHIAAHFTVFSAFAYLLFVLMYFPCLAVIGAARQEMGGYYAGVMAVYSTLLAWAVATLFYQVVEGHNFFYILLSFVILAIIYGSLYLIGKNEQEESAPVFAPPIRRSCCD